jgi:hypothetical protein
MPRHPSAFATTSTMRPSNRLPKLSRSAADDRRPLFRRTQKPSRRSNSANGA